MIGEAVDRRRFLQAGAALGAGLILEFYLPAAAAEAAPAAANFAPNAFLQISPDGSVTIWAAKSEMGQGIHTALPMIVAEELDADWRQVHVRRAPLDAKYGRQGTGGSTSVRSNWESLRKVGAIGRALLVTAAAQRWKVKPETCTAQAGFVMHSATRRKLSYGELVSAASQLPVPTDVKLKDPRDFRIVGQRIKRVDTAEKANGSAQFGIDVRLPGMLYASVAQCPVFGGKVATFSATRAKSMKGVHDVVEVMGGVGVIADSFWTALEARRALDIKWDEGPHAALSSDQIRSTLQQVANKPANAVRSEGDATRVLAAAPNERKLTADYETPILAHATMEPMNCTAHFREGKCEVWSPTQWPVSIREEGAKALAIKEENISVNITLMGGGFGRRGYEDFSLQAMHLSKAAGAPVKLVWTREDDMQHDFYRPPSLHRLSAALDAQGRLQAWTIHVIAPPVSDVENLEDVAKDLPYEVPNLQVQCTAAEVPVPWGWWRSVFAAQNGFAQECFLDELAAIAKTDPLQFRLAMLKQAPQHKRVLELAAEKAGWGKALPAGASRGIAVVKSFGSHVAMVAEVNAEEDAVRVRRVVCAVDCGIAINPDTIEAQMQGGIVYGLTAALYGKITIENGRVQQNNFNDYPMLRMEEMPQVEVYIVPSLEPPQGIGEAGVPPIAPAVANAIFAATSKPVRSLPLRA